MKRQLTTITKKSEFISIDLLIFIQINLDLSMDTIDSLLKQIIAIDTDTDKVLKVVIKGTKAQMQMFNIKDAKQRIKVYTKFLDVVFSFDIVKECMARDVEMTKEENVITLLEKYLIISNTDEQDKNRILLKGKSFLGLASI